MLLKPGIGAGTDLNLLQQIKVKKKVMDLYSAFQMGYALPKALYM